MQFVLRRVLHSLLLLTGASMLAFALVNMAPGDYFTAMRADQNVSPQTIDNLRVQYGLDRPLPVRYLQWLRSIVKGEWGYSFAYGMPAGPILWARARSTLLLSVTATVLAWLMAIPLGVWAAARPASWIDAAASTTGAALLAIPEIVLALLALKFAAGTGWLPIGGMTSPDGSESLAASTKELLKHLILPALCLAGGLVPILLSHVRSAVGEVWSQPYIAAATALGIPEMRLLVRHALPAAANPLISLFGLSVGLLTSSSLLIEGVFSWPGVGQLMLEAIMARDSFVVVDSVVLATAFLISGNLLADTLLFANDVRMRSPLR